MNIPEGTTHYFKHDNQTYYWRKLGKKWQWFIGGKFEDLIKVVHVKWFFGWRVSTDYGSLKHKLIKLRKPK